MDPKMIALVAVALVVALWPQVWDVLKRLKLPSLPEKKADNLTYGEAMIALAVVRERLVETDCLADDANKAIEVITHSLVEGSDQ
jgi:hypothetical protein